ncbi:MAG: ABC transporter substrate-binding protein [Synergistaceae bacterium]|jgi:ABC-type nitrate/sulfonate/bicarbonate transport system substrate-binding protein|nr:ABC transporter substrate-binding protein [Synergistaceae bacterium]
MRKISILLAMLLLVGIAAAESAFAAEKKYHEIRIPENAAPTNLYTPYLADELGFFEEEGIKPIFVGVVPSGQFVASVVAGTTDVGTLHVNRAIAAIAAGAKIKCVVAGSVTTQEYPHMSYAVLEDSPIRKAEDLVGKKIGIISMGGCNESTVNEWYAKNTGENHKGKFDFVLVPTGNEEVVLRNGEVDVVGFHGIPHDVFERGGIRTLFTDYDVWGELGGATPFYVREDFIARNPDAIKGFVTAMARANNWFPGHEKEALEIQAKRRKVEPIQVTVKWWEKDGIITPESIQLWVDLLLKYGDIKVSVPLEKIYTNEFNRFAK